jgi:hypothetical protein
MPEAAPAQYNGQIFHGFWKEASWSRSIINARLVERAEWPCVVPVAVSCTVLPLGSAARQILPSSAGHFSWMPRFLSARHPGTNQQLPHSETTFPLAEA